MKLRVAINGFGRIGRVFLRSDLSHPKIEVVAINDLSSSKIMDFLLLLVRFEVEIDKGLKGSKR